MKPCANKRKQIAGLAVNALEARSTRELHAHFETCAGCRRYWAEMSRLTEQLAAAAPEADLRATESFHQRVMAGLEAEAPVSLWTRMIRQGRTMAALHFIPLSVRVALPVAVVVLAMLGIWIGLSPRTHVPISPSTPAGVSVAPADAGVDLTPSLANYQRAADQSLDKLDDLLARQQQPAAGSGPVYTAGMMSMGF
jgi:hypothetical protein